MERKKFGHIEVPLKRVHIELTNICEFNCLFCPKREMKRPPGYMETALAKRIITELKEGEVCEKVTFHVMGEPTLHKDLEEILEHAEAVGMNVGLTTNGAGLGGRAGQMLLKHRLHQVDVSLQTPDAESFKLRGATKRTFEEYLEGVLAFFKAYHAAHMAEAGGEGTFKFRFLNTTLGKKSLERRTGPIKVISSTRELRESFRYFYPGVFFETYVLDDWGHAFDSDGVREAWAGYCYGMRDHFCILYSGDVTLCCVDYEGKTAVGNLNQASLLEILSSEIVGEIMKSFGRYRLLHPYCKRCMGSRSVAGWLFKPVLSVLVFKTLKPLFYRNTRLVD
jgi:MoaA/NifB/PqqE/SkfB family radical SAM enzyme